MKPFFPLLLALTFVISGFAQKTGNHRIITGMVKDSLGEPLIGAAVEVKDTKIGTVADIDGLYFLEVPKRAKILRISRIHFKSIDIPIGTNDTINAVLKWHGLPEPNIGFEAMERYIQKNLRYPKAAKKAKIEGKVVVGFKVKAGLNALIDTHRAADLSDFEIVQSLDYGCDKEAIRLLKEGSKWSLPNRATRTDTATYTVEFKLK